ncbi:MAG: hypothetical protein HETSPECPRED_004509 [Heterodermia speciosa]|uniref:Uncharacterized protein n=1 Tax=Heterodermia speciosa TaxID=116794 RepID=A0A8H3IPN2_9LECA|nr:MAG: hypothetical protein HETSPECPRED_004509 [Heterodermia speciosa]
MATPINEAGLAKKTTDVYDLVGALEKSDNGVAVLCGDGVVRSFSANLTVLAYQKLDAQQIQKVVDDYGRDDKLTKVYAGVNGHDVVDTEQLLHPSKDLLPKDFGKQTSCQSSRKSQTADALLRLHSFRPRH